ncbi:MAG: hypothetical protein RQ867_06915, partial [Mariprofundaceae bacterium]|nr:hypothetical protein [Mariprofundaceae bacterium]
RGILPLTQGRTALRPISLSCEIVIRGILAPHPAGGLQPSKSALLPFCPACAGMTKKDAAIAGCIPTVPDFNPADKSPGVTGGLFSAVWKQEKKTG